MNMDTSIGGPRLISSDDTVIINTMVNGQKKYDVVKTHMTNKDLFQLVIRSLTETDSGLYMCQIYHPFMNHTQWPRKSGYLTVQGKWSFVLKTYYIVIF